MRASTLDFKKHFYFMKLNKMNKKIISVTICGLLLVFGCTKQLDQQPYGAISTTEYYKTQADALGAVNAVYHRLQDITFGGGFTGFDCWPDPMSPDVESHQDFPAPRQGHENTLAP